MIRSSVNSTTNGKHYLINKQSVKFYILVLKHVQKIIAVYSVHNMCVIINVFN